ncbi:hypothetical protein DAPPUDRAFT_220509 [Daphnia pulex]|uniref:Uncharacterized protein n=1 Tax=Daphnia pulex TaxID=6669 RepID=E9FTG1_DAPPU|nr:hypothetical protein DAPPUDRAFT_220509 [Daphnia pulex]|eukprot:EFX89355.1 hypothetical protein DAPPUDRAFT_220509 [Daphnia pulex]
MVLMQRSWCEQWFWVIFQSRCLEMELVQTFSSTCVELLCKIVDVAWWLSGMFYRLPFVDVSSHLLPPVGLHTLRIVCCLVAVGHVISAAFCRCVVSSLDTCTHVKSIVRRRSRLDPLVKPRRIG